MALHVAPSVAGYRCGDLGIIADVPCIGAICKTCKFRKEFLD